MMLAEQRVIARRTAVAAMGTTAVAVALAACTKGKGTSKPSGPATPTANGRSGIPHNDASAVPTPLGPDPTLVNSALAREFDLIRAYDAAAAAAPAVAALLADFRSHHEAHLARLQALPGAPPAPAEPGAMPATTPPATRSLPARPAIASRTAFAALAGRENAAARAGAAACTAAGPTAFAQLLAEIAGCEAQHGVLLPTFPAPAGR